MSTAPLIHVVDDDASMRAALVRLLNEVGFEARGYVSTGEFLLQPLPDRPGTRLNTRIAPYSAIAGTYDVIFYGCNYLNDPETIIFLDKAGDPYTFEPYAPDFNYRIKKGLATKEGLAAGDHLPQCSSSFRNAQTRSIIAPTGDIIGYEIRPLYHAFAFGLDDILNVYYRLKGDKVIITIALDPYVERMLREGAGRKRAIGGAP